MKEEYQRAPKKRRTHAAGEINVLEEGADSKPLPDIETIKKCFAIAHKKYLEEVLKGNEDPEFDPEKIHRKMEEMAISSPRARAAVSSDSSDEE